MRSGVLRIVLPAALLCCVIAGAILVWPPTGTPSVLPDRPCQGALCGQIRHIVIIVKENHSFDNLFGRMPGVDGSEVGKIGTRKVKLHRTPLQIWNDLGHGGMAAFRAWDHGRMDGFGHVQHAIQTIPTNCTKSAARPADAFAKRN